MWSYDVTSQLQNGDNAIGVYWVTDGITINPKQCGTSTVPPGATVPLSVWTCASPTPTEVSRNYSYRPQLADIIGCDNLQQYLYQQHYDARLEQKGWSTPEFDDSKWHGVGYRSVPWSNVTAQQARPIRNVETFPAVSFRKVDGKTYIYH